MLDITQLKKDWNDYYFVTEKGNTVSIQRLRENVYKFGRRYSIINDYLVGKIKLSVYDLNEEIKSLIDKKQEEKILGSKACKISIHEGYVWLKCYLYSNHDGYDVKYSTYIDVKTCEFIINAANKIEEII